jgi:FAD/FMN-containing dehydrogenase
MTNELLQSLSKLIDPSRIKMDAETLQSHGKDWTKYFKPNPQAVVFPKTTEEVRDLVLWSRKNKQSLVPSGGRTGLSGAAVAKNGEVVVSFDLMNKILEHNVLNATVRLQTGVITEELQKFAEEKDLLFPVDFASRGSSQIGGNIATNAGGIKVIRYGLTRDWVAALQVVTGAGEILNINQSLIKNATGYDLKQLFIGSEGTLGFVTEATLRLAPPAKPTQLICLALENLPDVMKVFTKFRNQFTLMAFEMFGDPALTLILSQDKNASAPFETRANFYLLIEVELHDKNEDNAILEVFESCMNEGWVTDGVISSSEAQTRALWKLRENISEACVPFTPYKNDISVTISNVPSFVDEADKLLKTKYPDCIVIWFGHIGDGNLHINILKPKELAVDEFVRRCQTVDELLFSLIKKYQGSISAEHGVGLTKKPFLHFTRSAEEILLMKGIKKLFDPDGIMNPGKIFE